MLFAKTKSAVVAEPMIPLVDEPLVDLFEQHKTAVISAPYVRFGNIVTTGCDTGGYASNREILGGQLDEV